MMPHHVEEGLKGRHGFAMAGDAWLHRPIGTARLTLLVLVSSLYAACPSEPTSGAASLPGMDAASDGGLTGRVDASPAETSTHAEVWDTQTPTPEEDGSAETAPWPDVTGSDVTGSDVTGSDATGSDVTGSDVTGSDVTGSDGSTSTECETTGLGTYVSDVALMPENPTTCSSTSLVISGTHGAEQYDFGTTHTNVCQPPFSCTPQVNLTLQASFYPTNPTGPGYSAEFDLGTLEPYTYCAKIEYYADGELLQTWKGAIPVTTCP